VSGQLSWSHYCELLSISDESKRNFYEKETVNSNWSVREVKRQIDTSLFERVLLTEGNKNKEKVPIGIILCADKDEIAAEYALGELNNQIFASKYTLYIPEKEKLIKEVECVLEEEKNQ